MRRENGGNLFPLSELVSGDVLRGECPDCGMALREIPTDCACWHCPACGLVWSGKWSEVCGLKGEIHERSRNDGQDIR